MNRQVISLSSARMTLGEEACPVVFMWIVHFYYGFNLRRLGRTLSPAEIQTNSIDTTIRFKSCLTVAMSFIGLRR